MEKAYLTDNAVPLPHPTSPGQFLHLKGYLKNPELFLYLA